MVVAGQTAAVVHRGDVSLEQLRVERVSVEGGRVVGDDGRSAVPVQVRHQEGDLQGLLLDDVLEPLGQLRHERSLELQVLNPTQPAIFDGVAHLNDCGVESMPQQRIKCDMVVITYQA